MANATSRVRKAAIRWNDNREFPKLPLKTYASDTNFYVHAMIGLNVNGYHEKFDDTSEMVLAGVVRGRESEPVVANGTQGNAGHELDLWRPPFFELAITGIAITDKGKPVYASDDQTGTLDPSTRTYANFVGTVEDLVYVDGLTIVSNIALVRASYDGVHGHQKFNTARFLAATGNITLTKLDLFKTIFIQGTAAQTITLPAVAQCPAGSRMKFVKLSSNAVIATLDGNAAENIDGAATLATIDAQFDCAQLVSDGTQWVVTDRDIT